MRCRSSAIAVLTAVLAAGPLFALPAPAAPGAAASDGIVVDVSRSAGSLNRGLQGYHGRDDAGAVRTGFDDLRPRILRHVMSAHDFMAYDCATHTLDPSSADYFSSWLDAVHEMGAESVLSLSYVPECIARDGQPKGPTTDPVEYRTYLDQVFAVLVTDRVAAGKEPVTWFELWNEPDIPLDPGNPEAGHGFVGTVDEFVDSLLPGLAGAVNAAEATSGVDIRVGAPASFAGYPFSELAPDLATLLRVVNGFDPLTAVALAAQADAVLGAGATERILHNGGFTWADRVIAAAGPLGLEIDFVAYHHYLNNPLQGAVPSGEPEPQLLRGRNPLTSPRDIGRTVDRWQARYPGLPVLVTEWDLSAGGDFRHGTCEGAAVRAATMIELQQAGTDRALLLGNPSAPGDAALRAWTELPDETVTVTGTDPEAGTWSMAAASDDRVTLLATQWHSRLEDARRMTLPVRVEGLAPGEWVVRVESVDDAHRVTSSLSETTVTADGGGVDLPDDLVLDGQSLVRADLRRPDVVELSRLTDPAGTGGEGGPCLADPAPARPDGPPTQRDEGAASPIAAAPGFAG